MTLAPEQNKGYAVWEELHSQHQCVHLPSHSSRESSQHQSLEQEKEKQYFLESCLVYNQETAHVCCREVVNSLWCISLRKSFWLTETWRSRGSSWGCSATVSQQPTSSSTNGSFVLPNTQVWPKPFFHGEPRPSWSLFTLSPGARTHTHTHIHMLDSSGLSMSVTHTRSLWLAASPPRGLEWCPGRWWSGPSAFAPWCRGENSGDSLTLCHGSCHRKCATLLHSGVTQRHAAKCQTKVAVMSEVWLWLLTRKCFGNSG